jgi:hypothetical protein
MLLFSQTKEAPNKKIKAKKIALYWGHIHNTLDE